MASDSPRIWYRYFRVIYLFIGVAGNRRHEEFQPCQARRQHTKFGYTRRTGSRIRLYVPWSATFTNSSLAVT
jgi:hypothetical protein